MNTQAGSPSYVGLGGGQMNLAVLCHYTFDELVEDANVKCARSSRLGMELTSNDKPIVAIALDAFDDTILASSGYSEAICQPIDCHVVTTVDTDLSLAVYASKDRI